MVGVAGKSKACHSCKKRRITCGQQRPQCSQCIKSNVVCSGYQRDRVFINTGSTSWSQKQIIKSTTNEDKDQEPKLASPPITDSWELALVRPKDVPSFGKDSTQAMAPYAMYRQQLLSAFLRQLVPRMRSEFATERSWLTLVPEISTPTKALEVSTMALCMVSVGRRNEDLVLVQQSVGLYAQALREVQKALWDPQLMYKDDTLGACMACAMYELLGCPDANRRAYACHQDGMAKLVEMRGPEAHMSGFGHHVFLAFRTQNILQALERHRSTFLADQLWLSKPWDIIPKTHLDQLFDLCSLAPAIFEQGDKLADFAPHERLHEMLKMVNRCWKIDTDLEELLLSLKASTPGPLYWSELSTGFSPIEDDELGKVFPVAFHFINLKISYNVMFYWSTALILWSGLCLLYQGIYSLDLNCREIDCICLKCDQDSKIADQDTGTHLHKFDLTTLPPLEHRADYPAVARNICQSVEYCMQESMGQFGAFSAAAPLAIALANLKPLPGCSREAAWAEAAMAKIIGRGLRILKY